MSSRDMSSYVAVKESAVWAGTIEEALRHAARHYENSSFQTKFVRLLAAYKIISSHQSKQQN